MTTFTAPFRARWVDMDFNQHMRNAAYLGCAEDTRMLFMESRGWTMADFFAAKIGPVVLEDTLTYRRELKLLDRFHVDILVAGATDDFSRLKVRNRFFREGEEAMVAQVDSNVLWLDLTTRKPTTAPERLLAAWKTLTRSEDFEVMTSRPAK